MNFSQQSSNSVRIVRLELPQNMASSEHWMAAAQLASDFGDGYVYVSQCAFELRDVRKEFDDDAACGHREVFERCIDADACAHGSSQLSSTQPRGEEFIGWNVVDSSAEETFVHLGTFPVDGRIPASYAVLIGKMETTTVINTWGGIIFENLPESSADVVLRFLAPRGFIFDATSPLLPFN